MKIIVTSHGDLCKGIINSYEMLAGKNENILAVSLKDNDTGEFEEELTKIVKELDEEILILCDIFGGTPYNVSNYLYLEDSNRIRVISGLNLPMLLEAGLSITDESVSLENVVSVTIAAGNDSIKIAEEVKLEEDIF